MVSKYCWIVSSCLAAYILPQVLCSSASVNGKSRLLHFDWLFQTFWHWQVLLSCYRCSRWPVRHCFCVFENVSAIKHEREISLVLMCCVTDAFCACTTDACAQKTLYQKFQLIWFKMHDFSAIDMLIKTKHIYFSRVYKEQSVKAQPCSGRAAAHLHLKRQAWKQRVSASTQNGIFKII